MAGSVQIGKLIGLLELEDRFSPGLQRAFRTVSIAATAIVAGVSAAGGAIAAFAARGARLNTVEQAFNALALQVGSTGEAMLRVGQEATQGLVGKFDLLESANRGLLLGLPLTESEFGNLARSAVVLGSAVGLDATTALDNLITGLGRSSPLILDNLGLTINASEAYAAYAEELGKSVTELTDAEKQLGFYNAAMEAAKVATDNLGGITLTFGDHVSKAARTFSGFMNDLSVGVTRSDVLATGFLSIRDSITEAFGVDKQQLVEIVVRVIENVAIKVVETGVVFVSFGRLVGNIFLGIRQAIHEVLAFLFRFTDAMISAVQTVVNMARNVPLLGRAYEELGQKVDEARDTTSSFAMGFTDLADEGAEASATWNSSIDGVMESMVLARNRMIETRDSQKDVTEAVANGVTQADKYERQLKDVATETRNTTRRTTELKDEVAALVSKLTDDGLIDEVRTLEQAWLDLDPAQQANERVIARVAVEVQNLRERGGELSAELLAVHASTLILKDDAIGPLIDSITQLDGTVGLTHPTWLTMIGDLEAVGLGVQDLTLELQGGLIPGLELVVPTMADVDAAFGHSDGIITQFLSSVGGPEGIAAVFARNIMGPGGALEAVNQLATQGLAMLLNMVPGIGPILAQFSGVIMAGLRHIGGAVIDFFGGIGRAIGGLFGRSTADNVVLTFERMWGIDIPKSVAEGISDLSEIVGSDFGAILLSLEQAFASVGGVAAVGFQEATRISRDLFSAIQQGELTSEQAFGGLIDIIDDLATEFPNATEVGKAQFFELIQLAEQFGFDMSQIADIIGQDLVDRALGADLSTAVKDAEDNFVSWTDNTIDQVKKVEEEVVKLGNVLHDNTTGSLEDVTKVSSEILTRDIPDDITEGMHIFVNEVDDGFQVFTNQVNQAKNNLDNNFVDATANAGNMLQKNISDGALNAELILSDSIRNMIGQLQILTQVPVNIPVNVVPSITPTAVPSGSSFQQGTPNLDFQDFGRASIVELHQNEAIIPESGVGEFASQVASALGSNGQGRSIVIEQGAIQLSLLDGRDASEQLRQTITEVITDSFESEGREGQRLRAAARG